MNVVANAAIGAAVERIEDLRFLTGRGTYVADLQRENLAHAVIVRSSIAHGRIRSIDAAAARAMDGIVAVLTAAEIGPELPTIPLRMEPHPDYIPYEQPVIARDKVRYVGEPLAVILAESAAQAEDAIDAVTLDIEAIAAVTNRLSSMRGDALLVEGTGRNKSGNSGRGEGRSGSGVHRATLCAAGDLSRAAP